MGISCGLLTRRGTDLETGPVLHGEWLTCFWDAVYR